MSEAVSRRTIVVDGCTIEFERNLGDMSAGEYPTASAAGKDGGSLMSEAVFRRTIVLDDFTIEFDRNLGDMSAIRIWSRRGRRIVDSCRLPKSEIRDIADWLKANTQADVTS